MRRSRGSTSCVCCCPLIVRVILRVIENLPQRYDDMKIGSKKQVCRWASRRRPSGRRLPLIQTGLRQGIAGLSDSSYPTVMGRMKGITVKLPEAVARELKEQARRSGRSVAALVRERILTPPLSGSVYSVTADLAGSLAGGRLPATNARAKFRRP